MLSALVLTAVVSASGAGRFEAAMAHYHTVPSYRVMVHAYHPDGEEHIRYAYKKPGYVRMDFIRPHAGALLLYDPRRRRVRLWPFGFGHFPELDLDPANPLIRSATGQRVDRSDVGALFENVRRLAQGGSVELEDEQGRLHVAVTGGEGLEAAGVHSYELWLDPVQSFPLKVISRNLQGAVLETVVMENPELVELPDALFNPEGASQ